MGREEGKGNGYKILTAWGAERRGKGHKSSAWWDHKAEKNLTQKDSIRTGVTRRGRSQNGREEEDKPPGKKLNGRPPRLQQVVGGGDLRIKRSKRREKRGVRKVFDEGKCVPEKRKIAPGGESLKRRFMVVRPESNGGKKKKGTWFGLLKKSLER